MKRAAQGTTDLAYNIYSANISATEIIVESVTESQKVPHNHFPYNVKEFIVVSLINKISVSQQIFKGRLNKGSMLVIS